jgi:hypothetical protein
LEITATIGSLKRYEAPDFGVTSVQGRLAAGIFA